MSTAQVVAITVTVGSGLAVTVALVLMRSAKIGDEQVRRALLRRAQR